MSFLFGKSGASESLISIKEKKAEQIEKQIASLEEQINLLQLQKDELVQKIKPSASSGNSAAEATDEYQTIDEKDKQPSKQQKSPLQEKLESTQIVINMAEAQLKGLKNKLVSFKPEAAQSSSTYGSNALK